MDFVISGATGFIGKRLVEVITDAGHKVAALSRDPERAQRAQPRLSAAYRWDPAAGPGPPGALAADVVVNLAGEPVSGRWTRSRRRAIRESRVQGTRHLVDALPSTRLDDDGASTSVSPRPVLISGSAIGYYGDRGEALLAEDAGPGGGFLSEVCQAWEAEADRATAKGWRVVKLRTGIVLGPGGGALQEMLPLYRKGLGGPLGGGRQWWSWIHREDLVGLIAHLAVAEAGGHVSGAVNGVSPDPRRQKDFAHVLAGKLGRSARIPAPAIALRIALGGFSSELLFSRRCVPGAAADAGYGYRFPDLEGALADLVG